MSEPLPFPADFILAQRCLDGDEGAIRELQQTYREVLVAFLRGAGATADEAEEVIDGLWADCLVERPNRARRLATYTGQSSLKTWLHPLALNFLLIRKRREKDWQEAVGDGRDVERAAGAPVPARPPSEAPLLDLMREALEAGFAQCPSEHFVLLQLAHIDRLRMHELAVMFRCSTSKIDRDLQQASESVAEATLGYVRAIDPWLELKWEDFVELCNVATPACFGLE